MHTLVKVQKRFSSAKLRAPYYRRNLSLRVDYLEPVGLRFNLPTRADEKLLQIVGDAAQRNQTDAAEVMHRIQTLEQAGIDVHIYPDAEEFIQRQLTQNRLRQECREIRECPAEHPLRRELLTATLLPYQLDGIAFAVGAGRAILADDMGLGKTIQGIGVAELLARLAEIKRVLVICPASLKSQLVNAALALAGQLLQREGASEPDTARIDQMTEQLASLTQVDEQGRPQITISLPDEQSLRGIAATLVRLLQ